MQKDKQKKKTKYTLFHKVKMCDSVPLQLPPMALNNIEIKRENSVKFLGVIIDEKLIWKTIFKSENRKEKLFLKKFIYF